MREEMQVVAVSKTLLAAVVLMVLTVVVPAESFVALHLTRLRRNPTTRVSLLSRDDTVRRWLLFRLEMAGSNGKDRKLDSFVPGESGSGEHSNDVESSENCEDDPALESAAIDSFLRGDYDRPFAEDAPAPYPKLRPGATIDTVLRSLRQLDEPEPSHGAAVLLRFCAPLSRAERWGGDQNQSDPWKEVLRGALTPAMLARRLRASQFSGLLDWEKLDVTEGTSLQQQIRNTSGPTVAFVNAALFFGKGMEPSIIQFTLRRVAGVWLIDKARVSQRELFVDALV